MTLFGKNDHLASCRGGKEEEEEAGRHTGSEQSFGSRHSTVVISKVVVRSVFRLI